MRGSQKRESAEAVASEAQRLLDDPAFQRGFSNLRDQLIKELEDLKHDGQSQTSDYELEICRTLRTLRSLRRGIALGVQGQTIRLADFQAKGPEDKD